jgi:hypothetical protein
MLCTTCYALEKIMKVWSDIMAGVTIGGSVGVSIGRLEKRRQKILITNSLANHSAVE